MALSLAESVGSVRRPLLPKHAIRSGVGFLSNFGLGLRVVVVHPTFFRLSRLISCTVYLRGAAVSEYSAFAEAERIGWADINRATGYVDLFAAVADQVVQPLLNAVDVSAGQSALDLCCGQGNVAEALAARGGKVVGVDFSRTMLELARKRMPGGVFVQADVQNLPFHDTEFDAVISNVGVCHIPDQARALAEARRILRPKGRFGMSVWCGPDRSPSYEMVYRTIKEYGAANITAPPGPDFHQFSDPAFANRTLSNAGFSNIAMEIVECGWTLPAPEGLFDIFAKGTVRAAMLLSRQPPGHYAAIRSALAEEVRRRFTDGGSWRVPTFAAILSATA